MPLEQDCLSGREPRASSKNAKDRSNTGILLASKSTADTESIGRGSRCSSEKDSGYSDNNSCTDWLHVDVEDQGSSVSEPRGRERLQGQVKPEQAPLQGNHILWLSMPLEQDYLSGREPRTSSKNAKDRSNTGILLASRSTADTESIGRGSRCSSEKYSGYSDNNSCTDWLHVDGEDQGSSVSEPRGREGLQGQVKPEQAPLQGNHILVPSPRGPDRTPISIIKNVVFKQSVVVKNGSDHHLQNQLNWENRGGNSNDSGPCHVILVQQPSEASPSPSPASPKPHRTQARRADSTARKTKSRTYLPILKSYPRIAPHPSKNPSDKTPVDPHGKGTGSEDQSQKKRDEVSTTTHLQTPSRQHIRKQPDPKRTLSHWRSPASSHSPSPRSRSPSSLSSFGAPSLSSSDTCNASSSSYSSSYSSSGGSSPLPASRWPRRHGPGLSLFSAARDRCFLNTVGILSQSGLLDITLRTQDLLRQSNATDQVIAQLRQHTQLLYQAANNNNNPNANTASAGWERIHQAMAQSGCYPSLKNLGSEEDHHSYSPEPGVGGDASFKRDSVGSNINTHTHNWVQAPLPALPLLAPMSDLLPQYCPVSLSQHSPVSVTTSLSHSGQASAKPPETVTIMPPDSSTHGGLL